MIHIPWEDRTNVTIPQLQMPEARHTLGVQLAPDSNNKEEFKYLSRYLPNLETTNGSGAPPACNSQI